MYVQHFGFINTILIDWKIIHISFKKYFSKFNGTKLFRYSSRINWIGKFEISIIGFKLIGFFSFNEQITIITVMSLLYHHYDHYTNSIKNLFFALLRLILNFSSVEATLSLISSVSPSTNNNNYFCDYGEIMHYYL